MSSPTLRVACKKIPTGPGRHRSARSVFGSVPGMVNTRGWPFLSATLGQGRAVHGLHPGNLFPGTLDWRRTGRLCLLEAQRPAVSTFASLAWGCPQCPLLVQAWRMKADPPGVPPLWNGIGAAAAAIRPWRPSHLGPSPGCCEQLRRRRFPRSAQCRTAYLVSAAGDRSEKAKAPPIPASPTVSSAIEQQDGPGLPRERCIP